MGRPVIALPLFFVTGSACHYGSLCPFPFPSTFLPSLLPSSLSSTLPIGPASHCGWSRPFPPSLVFHLYTLSLSRPGLSLWQVPPGLLPPSPTSLLLSFSHFLPRYLPLPSPFLPFWPGLSLWQVPPSAFPSSLLSLSTLPSYLSHFTHLSIPATSSPLARLVIVAGPAHFFPFPAPSPSSSPLISPSL